MGQAAGMLTLSTSAAAVADNEDLGLAVLSTVFSQLPDTTIQSQHASAHISQVHFVDHHESNETVTLLVIQPHSITTHYNHTI